LWKPLPLQALDKTISQSSIFERLSIFSYSSDETIGIYELTIVVGG